MPELVTCETVVEDVMSGRVVDSVRLMADSFANGTASGQQCLRAMTISFESLGGAMVRLSLRTTVSTASKVGREIVCDWEKQGLKLEREAVR